MLTTLGMVKSYKIGSIRSQAPNRAKIKFTCELVQRMEKVQRLDGSGYERNN